MDPLYDTQRGLPARLRGADDRDVDAIMAIRNHAILHSTAMWTDEIETRDQVADWVADHRARDSIVVATLEDDRAIGFGSFGPWRSRSGYRYTVENSVYLHHDHQRRGIGRQLMIDIIERARGQGFHVMMAGIEAGNAGSIRMHRDLGFTEEAVIAEVGYKFGRWLDLAYLRLELA